MCDMADVFCLGLSVRCEDLLPNQRGAGHSDTHHLQSQIRNLGTLSLVSSGDCAAYEQALPLPLILSSFLT